MPATSLPLAPPLARPRPQAAIRTSIRALVALTKPRLAFLSVMTTMAAYGTARPEPRTGPVGLTLVGTTLAAAGALSLNQWWERRADARMRRTLLRPLPQGQLKPRVALGWSLLLSLGGVGLLAGTVNVQAAALAALTILLYGVGYTPLKRHTRWATEVGAVSGALPALLGNAAAGHLAATPGLVLAAILLCWQMPHFFAIGWRHRADYRAAGFLLRPAVDPTGRSTAAWSLGYALLLVPVSLGPWLLGWFGPAYGVPTAIANGCFLLGAWRFVTARPDRDTAARRLFLASLLYLPVVMGALVLDWFLGR
ncbi:MAG: protoheme IX farnesyltransferase [Verrucomicrobia bacterium]|nr:protoheme IX farnesyltransferase [Verrucomicrobiota bacterium]